jgi:hypothetical protein
MTINQTLVDKFIEYLGTLSDHEALEVVQQVATKGFTDKRSGVLAFGVPQDGNQVGAIACDMLEQLEPCDQIPTASELIRVLATIGSDLCRCDENPTAAHAAVIDHFERIASHINYISDISRGDWKPPAPSEADQPTESFIQHLDSLPQETALHMLAQVAGPFAQKSAGSLIYGLPDSPEGFQSVILNLLRNTSPQSQLLISLNLLHHLSIRGTELLSDRDLFSKSPQSDQTMAVFQDVSRLMQAFSGKVHSFTS